MGFQMEFQTRIAQASRKAPNRPLRQILLLAHFADTKETCVKWLVHDHTASMGQSGLPPRPRVRHLTLNTPWVPKHPTLEGLASQPGGGVRPRRPPTVPGGGDPCCTEACSPRSWPGDVGDGVGAADSESETKLGAGRAFPAGRRRGRPRPGRPMPPHPADRSRASLHPAPRGTGPAPPRGTRAAAPLTSGLHGGRAASRQAAVPSPRAAGPHAAPTQPAPALALAPAPPPPPRPPPPGEAISCFPSHGGGRGRGRAGGGAGRVGDARRPAVGDAGRAGPRRAGRG